MEKYKLLVGLFLVFAMVSLVSAVEWNMPNQANMNSNFDININGSGMYCIEANIPSSFIIVSDQSNGVFSNGIYKTCYASNFKITLRPTQVGNYILTSKFSDGSGIKDLESKTIQINQVTQTPSCPTCPSSTSWSNCENNQQMKITYSCSFQTNYTCVQSTETQPCQSGTPGSSSTCKVGYVCKDSSNAAYQSSDCSISSIQNCPNGCLSGACIPSTDNNNLPNLTIDINPVNQTGMGNPGTPTPAWFTPLVIIIVIAFFTISREILLF